VVINIDHDIDQIVTRDHGAVGMIRTPGSGFAIELNVFPLLEALDELVVDRRTAEYLLKFRQVFGIDEGTGRQAVVKAGRLRCRSAMGKAVLRRSRILDG
jgi:hypothetical protein